MSYLVLARKYRPRTFDEIVGQEHVTRTLVNAFERGRVHHAFLFCGARGVGKTTAARVLAKALCCEKGPSALGCGECEACRTITDGSAVDYHEIDGASNNSVDDVRELRDGVRYQPAQLKRKIYVIDEVHMLSTAAFNALLKTLEEPPPHVTFIFATTEVHKIPVTILSRCQRYDFKLVPTPRLAAHLEAILGKESIPVDREALALLAREAGGSVRDALSLTDMVIAYTGGEKISEARVAEVLGVADRKLLMDLVGGVVAGDVRAVALAIEAAVDRGVDLGHLARNTLALLRDLIVVGDVKNTEGLLDASADELAALSKLAAAAPRPQRMALFERMARACEEMRESPAPRLTLEVALIDMATTEPLVPVVELVERLDGLERRLRGGGGGAGPSGPGPSGPGRGATRGQGGPRAEAGSGSGGGSVSVSGSGSGGGSVSASASVSASVSASDSVSVSASDSVSASASAPVPPDPLAAWERAVVEFENAHMMLAGLYSQARLIGWTERGLELGFTKSDPLAAGRGTDADNVARLKAFLAKHLGRPVDVTVKIVSGAPASVSGGAPARSVVEIEQDRKRVERERRESEARQHPSTQAAIDVFGAAIKEIKVDG